MRQQTTSTLDKEVNVSYGFQIVLVLTISSLGGKKNPTLFLRYACASKGNHLIYSQLQLPTVVTGYDAGLLVTFNIMIICLVRESDALQPSFTTV